ncbi:MAG: ABC transporter ATP-binding protein [Conexibacter sp.]
MSRLTLLPRRALAAVGRLVTMRRKDDAESPFAFLKDFRRIGPYLRPHKGLAITSLVLMALSALMALLAPWPLAILLDTVLGEKPLPSLLGWMDGLSTYELLAFAVLSGLFITALEHGLAVYDNYVNTKLDQSMVLDLRSDMFRHAQGLSMAYHDSKQMGKLMFQINTQASAVGAVTVSIPPLLQSVLTLVGMFVVIEQIQPVLALLSLTVVPFVYLSAGYYTRRIEPRVYEVRKLEGDSLTIVHEAMSMLRVIVAFGRERHEYGRFRAQGEEAVAARVHLTVRQTIFTLAVTMITAIGTALVLGFGAHHVLQKDMTAGELVVVMGYIASMYKPLEQISTTFSSLQQAFISLRSAFDLLETEPEIDERPDALPLERVRGAVAFEHVDFAYRGRHGTLRDVTFEVAPGQCVAIVGPTGAGKSTLLSLLTRFYDPAAGRVLLDGHDVRDLQLQALRAQISVVLQEPLLFSASIRDNIRYGRLSASDEEVEAAARAANAHDFVAALPKGYDTRLGERGALLSGGERQRISVARAFLKDAPLLILDEPTSSIDSKTEAVILDALARLIRGRTTFVVAHRLSTVRDANLILVVDHGQVVEQGTHAQLLARGGLYAELFDAQRGAALPEAPVTLQPEAIAELRELATRRIRKDDPLEPAIRAARRVLGDLGLWEPREQPHLSIVAGGER